MLWFMTPRLFVTKGTCGPVPSCPQLPQGLPPVIVSVQSLEGAKVSGDWCVRAAPSIRTPSQAATEPSLGLKLAPRSEWALGVGKGQAVAADASEPLGEMQRPSRATKSAVMLRSIPAAGRLQLRPEEQGSCLLLAPNSARSPTQVHSCNLAGCSCACESEVPACPQILPAPWSVAPPQAHLDLRAPVYLSLCAPPHGSLTCGQLRLASLWLIPGQCALGDCLPLRWIFPTVAAGKVQVARWP